MATVIPMAGLGSRFATEGYRLPKPLVPVSGEPMIFNVIDDLPDSDNWIFIIREKHVCEYRIDDLLRSKVPDAEIISISELTEGQACTAKLAEPHLDPDEEVLVAACDHGFLYDEPRYRELQSREDVNAIVWTFTEQRSLEMQPDSWGWCSLDETQETVTDVSVKEPISTDPYHDHAIAGAFYFERAADFLDGVEAMVEAEHRVNDEFYMDTVPLFMNEQSVIFDVDLYISWGTPKSLYRYEEMEYRCEHGIPPSSSEQFSLWEEYFDD